MSEAMIERLNDMLDTIERNTPIVEQRLSAAGITAEPQLILSMAKYWDALERLAAE